ncbi:MAG: hypothetical protein GX492_12470 [Firmicutes bacterium]|nr:hypothetical protein [Bacillota bacterium]
MRRVGLSAAGCRLPSFFLLVTLRFPGWRGTIPIVFPLFVLEDLLESAGYLMSVLFFLCPALSQKARVDLGKGGRSLRGAAAEGGHWSYGQDLCADTSGPTLEHGQKRERFSIEFGPSWLFALARIVRTLRYQGRFTLVEVSEGSSGTEIAVRLV